MEFIVTVLIFLAPMVLMTYFLIIKPQKKQQKNHQNLLATLEKNDKIETYSGIIATVQSVHDEYCIINSEGSKLKVNVAAIARKIEVE